MHLCRSNQWNQASIWLGFKVYVCASYIRVYYRRVWQECRSFITHQMSLEKLRTQLLSFGELSPRQSLVRFRDHLCARLPSSTWSCSSYGCPSYMPSGHTSHSEQRTLPHAVIPSAPLGAHCPAVRLYLEQQGWQRRSWRVITGPCLPDHTELSRLFQTSQTLSPRTH